MLGTAGGMMPPALQLAACRRTLKIKSISVLPEVARVQHKADRREGQKGRSKFEKSHIVIDGNIIIKGLVIFQK